MTETRQEGASREEKASLMIEIGLKPGEVPLRLPVSVQNFAGGLLTLKVTQTMNWVEWETLPGHDSHLRLPRSRAGDTEVIPGKVAWIKASGPAGASVFLGMEVSQPPDQVQRLLEDQVLHTPKDIKDMWQQWDKVQVQKRRSAASILVMLILGIALVILGVGVLTAAVKLPETQGYGILALGGVLTLAGGIRFWWRRRV